MPNHDIKCKDCSHISTHFISLPLKENIKCVNCNSTNTFMYYGNYRSNMFCGISYFNDISNYGKKMTSAEIDRKCKEEGMSYGTFDEIQAEAKKYKEINKKESDKRDEKITNKIMNEFRKKGVNYAT